MILLSGLGQISAINLTVALIVYLMMAELGNEKMKKALLPVIIVLIAAFVIIAVMSVYSQLTH